MNSDWQSISSAGLGAAEKAQNEVEAFRIRPLPGRNLGWIARDQKGQSAFVLEVSRTSTPPVYDSTYTHILLRHGQEVEIQDVTGRRSVSASILVCKSLEDSTIELFERSVASVLSRFTGPIQAADLEVLIQRLHELFGTKPPTDRAAVLGLWGELLAIEQACRPETLLNAWRLSDSSRLDFSDGQVRIDVKTTTRNDRHHFVSHEQLRPVGGLPSFIVSIRTERVRSGGVSVSELWQRLRDQFPRYSGQLDQTVVNTLGSNWEECQHWSFDESAGLASMSVFDAAEVQVMDPLSNVVVNAKYEVDFDRLKAFSEFGSVPPLLREFSGINS